jgi:hypothetical protein
MSQAVKRNAALRLHNELLRRNLGFCVSHVEPFEYAQYWSSSLLVPQTHGRPFARITQLTTGETSGVF